MDQAHGAPVASDPAPQTDQYAHVLDVAGHLVPELVLFRRDLHAHPELSRAEFRTTAALATRLEQAGLAPRVRGVGSGLVCDIVPAGSEKLPFLAFRADIDALPVEEANDLEFRSRVPGVMHACGHDVHAAVVLGAGLTLAEMARAGRLERPVRLIFQPRARCTGSARSCPCTAIRSWTWARSACAPAP
jgi:amidohydrolase